MSRTSSHRAVAPASAPRLGWTDRTEKPGSHSVAYLLDTDTVSSVLRRSPHLGVLRRLALEPQEQVFTSAITVGELIYGAARRGLADLDSRIEVMLASLPAISFDEAAVYRYGVLRAELEQAGRRLDDPDLRIASIALANDLVLVSGNQRHFSRVPELQLENWLS